LKNAGKLVEEFKREYGEEDKEVRQQEQVEEEKEFDRVHGETHPWMGKQEV